MSNSVRRSALAFVGLAVILAVPVAEAQMMPQMYVYSVSFECGFQVSDNGSDGYEPMVKVANYATKIDIHNVGMNAAALSGDVFSTGGSRWASSVGPQPLPGNSLATHNATVIDCVNIATAITGQIPPTGKPFFTGIVTIRSLEPLIVWATKTTQVCAGLATTDEGQPVMPPIYYDIDGLSYTTTTGQVTVADFAIHGCPAVDTDPATGQMIPPPPGQGLFRGPNGGVPPGLRPIGPIWTPPSPTAPQGGLTLSSISISHSMDFERVEPMLIQD